MSLRPWNEDYASLFLLPHPFRRYIRVPGQMATFTLGKHTFISNKIPSSWRYELLLWQLLWWPGLSMWKPGLWLWPRLWLWLQWLQRPRVGLGRPQIWLLPPIMLWRLWIFWLLLKMIKTVALGLQNSNTTLQLILSSLSLSNEIQMLLGPSGSMYSKKDQNSHGIPETDHLHHLIPWIHWEFCRLSPVAFLWPIFNKAISFYLI